MQIIIYCYIILCQAVQKGSQVSLIRDWGRRCSPQHLTGLRGSVPMSTAEPYRDAKAKENTKQKWSTSPSCKVKWLGLGSIIWLKHWFSFTSDCFLSTKLRKFISQGLQLGQQKETRNSIVQQCLEMKSYPQKNLNRRRKEVTGYKSFLNAGMSLSRSLYGVAHLLVQKRLFILDRNY